MSASNESAKRSRRSTRLAPVIARSPFRLDQRQAQAEANRPAAWSYRLWVMSRHRVSSALIVIPLKADIHERGLHVRFVPKADIVSREPSADWCDEFKTSGLLPCIQMHGVHGNGATPQTARSSTGRRLILFVAGHETLAEVAQEVVVACDPFRNSLMQRQQKRALPGWKGPRAFVSSSSHWGFSSFA